MESINFDMVYSYIFTIKLDVLNILWISIFNKIDIHSDHQKGIETQRSIYDIENFGSYVSV